MNAPNRLAVAQRINRFQNLYFRILILTSIAVLYVLSPFDIIPEVVFGIFGFLDDILIFGLFMMYATVLFRNFLSTQAAGVQGS